MKASKVLPWLIFSLVLVLAWLTIGSSGYAQAPLGYIRGPDGWDFPGSDIKHIRNITRRNCAIECSNDPKCEGIVRDPKTKDCWLKTDMVIGDKNRNRRAFFRI